MTPAARDAVRRAAMPLDGGACDYDRLIERARAVDVVLLGEASHGTHEFHRERARITRRLIEDAGYVTWNHDALIHVDDTRAVEPLETTATWQRGELPDTYPHAV